MFICVAWHWKLTVEKGPQVFYKNGRQIVLLAQYLALQTETEFLISGDFNLPMDAIRALVTDHNNLIQNGINNVKPMFEELGYMDDSPGRRLLQLKIHTLARVWTKSPIRVSLLRQKRGNLWKQHKLSWKPWPNGRGPQLKTIGLPTYCPVSSYTKTQMYIPSRPPKHHGG